MRLSKFDARSNAGAWLRLAIVAFAYLYAFPYFPRLNNPNENVRFYMTAALAEYGTYEISAVRARWGWTNDQAKIEGRYYSVKAPGTSLLGAPAYWTYRTLCAVRGTEFSIPMALWLCRLTACTFPSLIFLWFFLLWLRREYDDPLVIDAVFFSLAIGSMFFAYSILFVSHSTSAICAFFAFWRTRAHLHEGLVGALWTGLLAAGVTLFEYPGLPASVVLTLYFLSRSWRIPGHWRRTAGFVLGGLVPTLMVMHFQWRAFGSPFTPGHLHVETDAFRAAHEQGFFGATNFHWRAFLALLFDLAIGLVPGTPLFALALWGMIKKRGSDIDRVATNTAIWVFVTTFVAICFMNNWRGGWTLGPRYLALTYPFIAWLAADGACRLRKRLPNLAAALMAAATLVATVTTGSLSVYFPHIPPQVALPMRDLMETFVLNDYAPLNALNQVDIWGTLSMLPMWLVLLGVPFFALRRARFWSWPLSVTLAIGFIGAQWLWPLPAPHIRATVFEKWNPLGQDKAAKVREKLTQARLDRNQPAILEQTEALERIYRAEGRSTRATRLRREINRLKREARSAQEK